MTDAPNSPERTPLHWPRPLLGGLGFSVLTTLSLPPLDLWPLALLALIPLCWAAAAPNLRPARIGIFVGLGVLPLWLYQQFWISRVSFLGWPAISFAMASMQLLFAWALAKSIRRAPARPLLHAFFAAILWTGIEYLRGEILFDGYAWAFLAHPLIEAPALAQLGAFAGVYGVSFCAALCGAFLASPLLFPTRSPRALLRPALALLILFAVWVPISLSARPRGTPAGDIHALILQTNLEQFRKMSGGIEEEIEDLARFERLIVSGAAAAKEPLDLIIWPETSAPGLTFNPDSLRILHDSGLSYTVSTGPGEGSRIWATAFADRFLDVIVPELNTPMLVGEINIEGLKIGKAPDGSIELSDTRRLNSAFLLVPMPADGSIRGRISRPWYDKIRLTPFGEYMPYVNRWRWLVDTLSGLGATGMKMDLAAGADPTVFSVPARSGPQPGRPIRFVTPICFEVTDAAHLRRMTFDNGERRADLLINLTNDGWFGDFAPAREQHLQVSRWRCLELATPMIRSANTGVSAFIDASGRVVAAGTDQGGRRLAEGTLTRRIPLAADPSIYARVGDFAGRLSLAVAAGILLFSLLAARRERSPSTPPPPSGR